MPQAPNPLELAASLAERERWRLSVGALGTYAGAVVGKASTLAVGVAVVVSASVPGIALVGGTGIGFSLVMLVAFVRYARTPGAGAFAVAACATKALALAVEGYALGVMLEFASESGSAAARAATALRYAVPGAAAVNALAALFVLAALRRAAHRVRRSDLGERAAIMMAIVVGVASFVALLASGVVSVVLAAPLLFAAGLALVVAYVRLVRATRDALLAGASSDDLAAVFN